MKDLKRFPTIGGPNAENSAFPRSYPLLPPDSNGLRVLLPLGFAEEAKSQSASYPQAQNGVGGQSPARLRGADCCISTTRSARTVTSKAGCRYCRTALVPFARSS